MLLPAHRFRISWILVLLLGLVLLLRLPSLFEPYWYGDEGIYLVLGQAMQKGAVLYRDIWDNKPPLLYLIYALVPTLLWAKVTATAAVLGTVYFVYKISKNYLATLFCGVLLSLPLLEGTIANAELYFTLPIVIVAFLLLKNIHLRPSISHWLIIGLCLTTAFLIKVPAIFDFVGLFLAWFIINRKIKPFFLFSLIPLISLISLVAYFYFNHALGDFLVASFSQNASYVAIDSGPFSKLSNPLFIRGLILAFGCLGLGLLYWKKKISQELLILTFWFGFSLYGALLSNRPYLHYLLQVVPPAVLLVFYLAKSLRKNLVFLVAILCIMYYVLRGFSGAFALDTRTYYSNFFDYISERKSWTEYVNYFDGRTSNNYDIANFLAVRTRPQDPIFVWGDNAFVYVLSNRLPVTKFIQAHHLTTIDPKNYELIIDRLNKYQPKFIVVSRPIGFAFPKLEGLIKKNYRLAGVFQSLYVYQNIFPVNPPKFTF